MKKLRIAIVVFFVIVAAIFGVRRVHEELTADYSAPVIQSINDHIEASVKVTDQELLVGMGTGDNLDGNVNETLMVVSKSKFIQKGTRYVNYAAFDQSNNVGTYTRVLTYTDYVSPHFSIHEPLVFLAGSSQTDILRNVEAYDCLDGNITSQIMLTWGASQPISESAQAQTINLQVTNSAGDTSTLELQALSEDYETYYRQSPHLKDYVIYVKVGEQPDYRSYIDGIWNGSKRALKDTEFDVNTDFQIDSSAVDLYTPGSYTVTYSLSRALADGTRQPLGTTVMYVEVEE